MNLVRRHALDMTVPEISRTLCAASPCGVVRFRENLLIVVPAPAGFVVVTRSRILFAARFSCGTRVRRNFRVTQSVGHDDQQQ